MQNYYLVDWMFSERVKVHKYGRYVTSHLGKKNRSVHGVKILSLSMILKLFQCCTIVGSPFCPILSIFQQLDVLFCLLDEY